MVTETVVLDNLDDTWRSIVNTGDYFVLAGHTGPFRLRFGINSVSEGMVVNVGESMKVEETVFIQPAHVAENRQKRYVTVYAHKA